jgi:hypothetical protein
MKIRYTAGAVLVFLSALILISPVSRALVGAIAECVSHPNGSGITLAAYETFVPNVNRLTGAGFYVDYLGPDVGPPVHTPVIGIRDNTGATLVEDSIDTSDGWHSFNFPAGLTVTPGATYRVFYENGDADWSLAYSDSASCYSGGQAYYDGSPSEGMGISDWTFRVSGYNYVAPTPTPTPAATPTPTPTVDNDASVSSDSDTNLGATLGDASDIQLLANGAEGASKKPMSNLIKILIGAGVFLILLLALLAYLVFIKKNKSLRKLLHLK